MFIRSMFYILLLLAVAGCGKFDAANQSDTKDLKPLENPVVVDSGDTVGAGDDQDPFPSSGSIFTVLTNLHPGIASEYDEMELELDIGTVSGTHGSFEARQGGDVTLHFKNSRGQRFIRSFSSGGNVARDVENNFWYRNDLGDLVWRGVFEGSGGALIVIVDGVYSDGDGGDPNDVMSGSVWYRQWQPVEGINPSGPIERCWYVSLGPYDCRFEISNDGASVISKGNKYNDQEYIKLAEFIDLSKDRTFKESY